MKKTLFEITGQDKAMYEALEEMEGELTTEMEKALIINEGELQSKSIAYIEVRNERITFILRCKEEEKRIAALRKAAERIVDRLDYGLLEAQKTFGDYEVGLTTITTRKSESITVEDVNALPKEFKVVKVTESADKKALKEAIKGGAKIEGVELVVNHNLRIK